MNLTSRNTNCKVLNTNSLDNMRETWLTNVIRIALL